MAMLMRLCGIVFGAVGFALVVMSIAQPSEMQVYGLTPETGAILLVGGVLSLGLSSLIERSVPSHVADAAPDFTNIRPMRGAADLIRPAAATAGAAVLAETEATKQVSAETISETLSGAKSTVSETIEALEQAKSDIRAALGGAESFDIPDRKPEISVPDVPSPLPVKIDVNADVPEPEPIAVVPEPVPAETETSLVTEEYPEDSDSEAAGEPGLFVVEEQTVRGRPARLLSDGTVEAETDEGWMRFENLEHLNEYLDMVAQS
jgi:hypothetical protein